MKDLPGLKRLTWQGDLAARMVAGMHQYLDRATAGSVAARAGLWKRDRSSWAKYRRSVAPNRRRLAWYLGVVDERVPVELRQVSVLEAPDAAAQCLVASGDHCDVYRVAWTVLPGVEAEGLLVEPHAPAAGNVVALPDADSTPEALCAAVAAQFAAARCRVLVPTLVNRDCDWSGVAGIMTNQPHREFVYRAAYELGRHVIGYEVQKVLAAVDWFSREGLPVGVFGQGEGGLIAFAAGALDERIAATGVSGYFGPREGVHREPIYRNVWRLLAEFGDAEIATLVAPRKLLVAPCAAPAVAGPPVVAGRSGAAPGAVPTPTLAQVRAELDRARALLAPLEPDFALLGKPADAPWAASTVAGFAAALTGEAPAPTTVAPLTMPLALDSVARQKRQFDQLVEHTQALMRESEYVRRDYWAKADPTDVKSWVKTTKAYRKRFHQDLIGKLPEPEMPLNPRARQVYETEAFTGYEVVLDVYPDVFAYGILLVPKGIPAGERRPVVVCQHGLEGRPQDVADPDVVEPYYKLFACRLAERGFVTFAPQNPYLGQDNFRVLQRLANPLGLSLFSFIIRQHQRILEFLKTLPYVDGKRLAFYGLSYGGKTALRVPAVLEDYCLSICSGDFDEWVWKNCSTRHSLSYMRTGEYEMPEWNLGMTFNHAEMTYLICPRPFMVERGHWDGVAWDEWVAYEYAKTRYRYDLLDLADRTAIEYFNGPHEIHAVGTFDFLERHLRP